MKRYAIAVVFLVGALAGCSTPPQFGTHWVKDGVSNKDAKRADIQCAQQSISAESITDGRFDLEQNEEDCMKSQGYRLAPRASN
jgi:hypothetical protein